MIAELVRYAVYLFTSGLVALTIAVCSLSLIYDGTPRCTADSFMATAGCKPGNATPSIDPLAWRFTR